MTLMGQDKPSLGSLMHFGVKGMRWGTRKSSDLSRDVLEKDFGKRALRRIDKKVVTRDRRTSEASTLKKAVRTEDRRHTAVTAALVIYGAMVARNLVRDHGDKVLASIITKKAAKNGAKAAANLLADSRGLTSYSAIDLSFNAAKNVWE